MNLQNIAFEIISFAGDSFSDVMTALKFSREKDFDQAKRYLQSAEKNLTQAHQVHSQLLFDFAQGKTIESDILLVHAQDHLTKAEVMVTVVEELIYLNETKSDR